MLLSATITKTRAARVGSHQVCARGWEDYMLETQYFLGDSRVDACLKDMSSKQLENLGLSSTDLCKVRTR